MDEDMTGKEKLKQFFGIHGDEVYEAWTEEIAKATAKELGVELTDAHWEVIRFLRVYYANGGPTDHAHELTEALEERFESEGGLKYLYRLLPKGPVSSGCQIAGIPVPPDARSSSFGSAM